MTRHETVFSQHGGLEVGRPKVHVDDAARQAACRKRRKAAVAPKSPTPLVVHAPFTVVGRSGRTILEVCEEDDGPSLRLYDADGRLAVTVAALSFGGMVSLNDGDTAGAVMLYCEDGIGRLDLQEQPSSNNSAQ